MNEILATVSFGPKQFTAFWDYVNAKPSPYLIINEDEAGNLFIVKLDTKLVKNLEDGKKTYVGTVNSADGITLKKG